MIKDYLYRLYDTVSSRGYVEIEYLNFDEMPERQGIVEGRLIFYDGSLLEFDETILVRGEELLKLRYAYHYQNASGEIIFRYDNAPHYPNIPTYPHHKHVGSTVQPSSIPDLSEVLSEVEQMIFATEE
jgi:hypothetical protein